MEEAAVNVYWEPAAAAQATLAGRAQPEAGEEGEEGTVDVVMDGAMGAEE